MIRKKRLVLSFWGYLDHFKIPLFILLPVGFLAFSWLKDQFGIKSDGVTSSRELLGACIPFICVSAFMFYNGWRKLELLEVKGNLPEEMFKRAVNEMVGQFGFSVQHFDSELFVGSRRSKFTNDYPNETIVIIRTKNAVLYNSSYSKKSFRSFLQILERVTNPSKANTANISAVNTSEWSLKATIKRVSLYLISLTLLFLCFLILSENCNLSTLTIAIPIITLSVSYIVLDVRVLMSKK